MRDVAESFFDKNKNATWDPGETFTDANGDGVWTSAEPFNDTNRNGIYEPPVTQADLNTSLSGDAYVGNNYSGLDPALRALVLAPPKIGGIESLSSEVRVKHGQLSVGGNAKIGTNEVVDGGLSKSKIDGSYVSDGYRGDSASHVFSDNGTSESYDLASLNIKFPLLAGIGAQTSTDSQTGTVYVNHEQLLLAKGLPVSLTGITPSTLAFVYPADGVPDAKGNFIRYTPAAGGAQASLLINGIILLPGSFTVSGNVRYTGRGTFYSPGDVVFEDNLLPAEGQTFPTTTVLGCIAKGNMVVGDTSQANLIGAFFAQGVVKTTKQTDVVGSLVGSYYDMGTNVPSIFQVPSLARNMPPGMPGDRSIISVKVRGWRER